MLFGNRKINRANGQSNGKFGSFVFYTNNSKIIFATEFTENTEENNKEKWGNLRKGGGEKFMKDLFVKHPFDVVKHTNLSAV